MDEPTATLTEREIEDLFERHPGPHRDGIAVLYISHRLDEIVRIADRVTVMRDGQVVETLEKGEIDEREIVELMVGREIENLYPKEDVEVGDVLLRVEGHHAPRRPAATARSRSTRARSSASRALIGAGRTELARAVFGADPIDGGRIELDGEALRLRSPRTRSTPASATSPRTARARASRCSSPSSRTSRWPASPEPGLDRPRREHGRPRSGRTSSTSGRRRCARRSRRCPAATSRRSWSRSGWRPTRACCSSTSPRAASTSAPRPSCSS